MTNVSGKVVMDWEFAGSQGLFNERLDVSRFPEGVYVMKVLSGNESMSKKIVLR
jgi:hypothetical protein